MRISTFGIISILIGILLTTGCSTEKKTDGGPIVVQLSGEPKSLHPFAGNDANRTLLYNYIGQRLLAIDPESGSLIPILAEKIPTISNLGKRFSFRLNKQAAWSDGSLITPADVTFSIKAILATEHPQARIRYLLETLEDVTILHNEPNDIQFTFSDISVYNQNAFLSIFILDKRVYDPENLLDSFSVKLLLKNLKEPETLQASDMLIAWNKHIMGEKFSLAKNDKSGLSGPYYVKNWIAGNRLTLVPNDGYWAKGKPDLHHAQQADSIIFRFVSEATAIRLQLRQEKLDIGLQLPNQILNDSLKLPNFDIKRYNGSAYTYLAFNVRPLSDNPLLNNTLIRQAVSRLLPVDEIMEDHYEGRAIRVLSPIPPGHPDHNDTLDAEEYSIEKVKAMLDEAGFVDTNKDLVREVPDGKGTKLSFLLAYPAGVPAAEATALRLRESARKAGIVIEVEPLAFSALIPRLQNHNFEAVLMANAFSLLPYDFSQDFSPMSPYNFTGYGSEELDSLILLSRKTMAPDQRRDIVWQIQEKIHQAKPIVYLFTTTQPVAIHKSLGEVEVMSFSPYIWLNSLSK